jgi:hypothetical protein
VLRAEVLAVDRVFDARIDVEDVVVLGDVGAAFVVVQAVGRPDVAAGIPLT